MGLETIADWPQADGKYKLVQFIVDNKPHLRFGGDMHYLIIQAFAGELGVKTVQRGENMRDFLPPDERFKMVGASRCEIKTVGLKRKAEFYGASLDYGIGIDEAHLELIKPLSRGIEISYTSNRIM